MTAKYIHSIDTETTGLPWEEDAHVIEIAAATFNVDSGEIVKTFTSLVNPPTVTKKGLETAKKISGITEDEIFGAPLWTDVWQDFQDYLAHFPRSSAWTSWNVPFDRAMIRKTFLKISDFDDIQSILGAPADLLMHSRHGWPERFEHSNDDSPWGECEMHAYARKFPTIGSTRSWYTKEYHPNFWSLSKAAETEGIEFEGDAHRALNDAVVAAKIYHAILSGKAIGPANPHK